MQRIVTIFLFLAVLTGCLTMFATSVYGQQVEIEPDGTVKLCTSTGDGGVRICF